MTAAVETTESVKKAIGLAPPSRFRRARRVALLVALLALATFLVVRVVRSRATSQAPAYELADVRRADVKVTVTATGTLQAVTTVEVGAEVTGRVLRMTVDANDLVKKGQLLAVIDPEQLRAAADVASAQVASADAAIALAKATLLEATMAETRARQMTAEGLGSQKDLESAIATKERSKASLASAIAGATLARATLKSAVSRLDKATIVSPIDGIVLARLVEPGATVTAGFQTPVLFRLAQDLTQMRLNADIDEADVGRVREGMDATFTVDAYPERTFPSRLTSLRNDPKTSQNVVTYQAVLSVDNGEKLLRPGMTCTATIVAETRRAVVVVPNAALRFAPPTKNGPGAAPEKKAGTETDRATKQRVWILTNGKPEPVPVRAGATDGTVTEILGATLQPGAKVVVDVKEAP